MGVTIEILGLAETVNWAGDLNTRFKTTIAAAVLEESLDMKAEVKYAMPVDTGWARERWGEPMAFGGVWDVQDDGLSIEQGADLEGLYGRYEYIIRLNEGSSTQAPAGFIDVIAERGGERFETLVTEMLDDVDS